MMRMVRMMYHCRAYSKTSLMIMIMGILSTVVQLQNSHSYYDDQKYVSLSLQTQINFAADDE